MKLLVALACLFSISVSAEVAPPAPGDLAAGVHKEHPRILARAADFERIRTTIKSSPPVAKWADAIRSEADALLKASPSKYEIPDGKRLLATSRRVCERALTLGLCFQLTADERYAERLWQEIDAAAQFPDWNPKHFLDTAEMTAAFAIAYDWLHAYWTPERRTAIRTAIVQKGLNPSLAFYRNGKGWVAAEHNWNQVCNGGMTIGALAIAEDEAELAGEIIATAVRSVPRAMKHFAPDGAWGEGPGYWDYATQYNVLMVAALQSAMGTDFGLSEIEGFSRAGDFPIHITGPLGRTFNYADAGEKGVGGSQMLWFAGRFNVPSYAAWRIARVNGKPDALDLLWGAAWLEREPTLGALPTAKYFRDSEVVVMRSAWEPAATFVGFKGGDNRVNHGHLDLGSFVLDAAGQRWALDLGGDDYNLPGYFGRNRWSYYRCRAEGQNALVINPGTDPDQDLEAKARVMAFHSEANSSSAVVDLTQAYARSASSVRRGVRLKGRNVLVQDEVKAGKPAEVWWFMHTEAEVSTDGPAATLTMGGKKLTAKILQPRGARFEVMPAEPLPSSPKLIRQQVKGPGSHRDSTGVRKLVIKLNGVTDTRIAVELVPEGEVPGSEVVPLAKWPAN